MKWLRNLFIPKHVWYVECKDMDNRSVTRVFIDIKTMDRWESMFKILGYKEFFIKEIPVIINNKGN